MDEARDVVKSQFTLQPGVLPGDVRSWILAKMELSPDYPHLAYCLHSQPHKTRIELVSKKDMATALDMLVKAMQHAIKHQPHLIIYNTVCYSIALCSCTHVIHQQAVAKLTKAEKKVEKRH